MNKIQRLHVDRTNTMKRTEQVIVIAAALIATVEMRVINIMEPQNVVTVPPFCKEGQEWVNGECKDIWNMGIDALNVVTVPTNCRPGQVFINGQCRDVWIREQDTFLSHEFEQQNVVTVPPNCEDGQEWINGECREIWRRDIALQNVVTVPPNCPEGQEYINGQCRDVWIRLSDNEQIGDHELKNVVTVPPNCANGQQWINGQCRDIWRYLDIDTKNVITVPPNCPPGQVYINGQCRDIWLRYTENEEVKFKLQDGVSKLVNEYIEKINSEDDAQALIEFINQIARNVISVPTQCPNGYQPDANGICREVWQG